VAMSKSQFSGRERAKKEHQTHKYWSFLKNYSLGKSCLH